MIINLHVAYNVIVCECTFRVTLFYLNIVPVFFLDDTSGAQVSFPTDQEIAAEIHSRRFRE